MLHIAAATQIRLDTPGRAYYRRKLADGQDPDGSHALPQTTDLRRRLPAARRRRPHADKRREHGPGRALRGVSRIQRGRPAPAHRHFGSATSRTRATDATTAPGPRKPTAKPSHDRLTTEGSRKDASAHWLSEFGRASSWGYATRLGSLGNESEKTEFGPHAGSGPRHVLPKGLAPCGDRSQVLGEQA